MLTGRPDFCFTSFAKRQLFRFFHATHVFVFVPSARFVSWQEKETELVDMVVLVENLSISVLQLQRSQ